MEVLNPPTHPRPWSVSYSRSTSHADYSFSHDAGVPLRAPRQALAAISAHVPEGWAAGRGYVPCLVCGGMQNGVRRRRGCPVRQHMPPRKSRATLAAMLCSCSYSSVGVALVVMALALYSKTMQHDRMAVELGGGATRNPLGNIYPVQP